MMFLGGRPVPGFALGAAPAARIVQRGAGDPRPLLLVYHLDARDDDALRGAVPPATLIANVTQRGSDYLDTPPIADTLAQISELAGGVRFTPVIVAGFSAGGFATKRILDQGGDPDALVVADGTYGSSPGAWADYAARARRGERVFIASHTALQGPTSTWRVLSAIVGFVLPLDREARLENGNFIVYSYPTQDLTGHQRQGDIVLPAMLHEASARTPATVVTPRSRVGAVFGGLLLAGGAAAGAYLLLR